MKINKYFLTYVLLFISVVVSSTYGDEIKIQTSPTRSFNETIKILPVKELNDIIKDKKEGMFLPYRDYKTLYEKAKKNYLEKLSKETARPFDPVITKAMYNGVLKDKLIDFHGEFTIVQNNEKKHLIILPLKGVLIKNATLNGKNVHIYSSENDPKIIVPGSGEYDLKIDFVVPLEIKNKSANAKFFIPEISVGEIKIISQNYYDVKLKDLWISSKKTSGDKIEVFGFTGGKKSLEIEVSNIRSPGDKIVKIFSKEEHFVKVSKDLVESEYHYDLSMQGGEVSHIEFMLDKNSLINEIKGAAIASSDRVSLENYDILKISFSVPQTDATKITIKTFSYLDSSQATFKINDVFINNVFERDGILSIFYKNDVRLKSINENSILTLRNLKETDYKNNLRLLKKYNIFNSPYEIEYQRLETPLTIKATSNHNAKISRSEIDYSCELNLSGLKSGTTKFVFDIPNGYFLRNLKAEVNRRPVGEFHEEDADTNTVKVEIARPVGPSDMLRFRFLFEKTLDDKFLDSKILALKIPQTKLQGVSEREGIYTLKIDNVYLIQDLKMDGFLPVDFGFNNQNSKKKEQILNYSFQGFETTGQIEFSYYKPQLNGETLNFITFDEDFMITNAFIKYEISNGSEKEFFVAVPKWKDGEINITGSGIKEKIKITKNNFDKNKLKDPPEDITDFEIWKITLQSYLTEEFILQVDYRKKIETDRTLLNVPLIMPLNVTNETGYLIVEASRETDIESEISGFNSIETYEIPSWPAYSPSSRIIESLRYFRRPFKYQIKVAKRNDLSVLPAYVESENIIYTISKNANVLFECNYKVKNTNLQFLELQLPKGYELWSTTLQNKGIKPRVGSNGYILLPLKESESISYLNLKGYLPDSNNLSMSAVYSFNSPEISIPALNSNVKVYYPDDVYIYNIKGNFDELPEYTFDKPLLMKFFSIFRVYRKDIALSGTQHFLPLKTEMMVDEEADVKSFYKHKKKSEYARSKEDSKRIIYRDQIAGIGKKEKKKENRKKHYHSQKGLLSIDITMPLEKKSFECNKLWGEGQFNLFMMTKKSRKFLRVISFLIALFAGLFVISKNKVSALMYVVSASFIFTLIPRIGLKPYIFMMNSALLGCVVSALYLVIKEFFLRNLTSKTSINIVIFFISLIFFISHKGFCDEDMKSIPSPEIYVPYGENIPMDLNDLNKVYIPTKDYFNLKFLADPLDKPKEKFEYENEYDLTDFQAKGFYENDKLKFTATIQVFVNNEKWQLIKLPFKDVFIETLSVDGETVPVPVRENAGNNKHKETYEVPVLGEGGHKIKITFLVKVISIPGKKEIDFSFPETISSFCEISIDNKDLNIEILSPTSGGDVSETEKGYLINVASGLSNRINISWYPRKFLKDTVKPLTYTRSKVELFIDYDHVSINQKTSVNVEKSSIVAMSFLKEPDLIISDIYSKDLKNWKVKDENGKSVVEVILKKEISDFFELNIKGRYKTKAGEKFPILFFKPIDSKRIQGEISFYGRENFQIILDKLENLKTISSSFNLKETEPKISPDRLFKKKLKFLTGDFSGICKMVQEKTKMNGNINSLVIAAERNMEYHINAELNISKGNISFVNLKCPPQFKIKEVRAVGMSDWIFDDMSRVLHIPLTHSVKGKYHFSAVMNKALSLKDDFLVEGVQIEGLQRINGRMEVKFPKGYTVVEKNKKNLKSISVSNILPKDGSLEKFDSKYAYEFNNFETKVNYNIIKKDPLIDVLKVNYIKVQDNLVKCRILSIINVKNAPTDCFAVTVPIKLMDSISVSGKGIKTVLKKSYPEKNKAEITVRTLSLIESAYLMDIVFDVYFDAERMFELPKVIFQNARDTMEFISVESDTTYQVEPLREGNIREIETDQVAALPEGINNNKILWSYRVGEKKGWRYRIKLKRFEREKLIEAKILRQDIKSLVVKDGIILHEVTLKMKNKSLQVLPLLFPKDSSIWSVKVAGESVRPAKGDPAFEEGMKTILIPLIKTEKGKRNFDIKIVFISKISPMNLKGMLDINLFNSLDIAVEKTSWTHYLPDNFKYYNFEHNMNEVDESVIAAEKTIELAKEYEYWTNIASKSKGELKASAIQNRESAFKDYEGQRAITENLRSRISDKLWKEKSNKDMLNQAISKNALILDKANGIMRDNLRTRITKEDKLSRGRKTRSSRIDGRENLQGWQIKTKGFVAQNDVQQSISDFVRAEKNESLKQQKILENRLEKKMPQIQALRNRNAERQMKKSRISKDSMLGDDYSRMVEIEEYEAGEKIISQEEKPKMMKEQIMPEDAQDITYETGAGMYFGAADKDGGFYGEKELLSEPRSQIPLPSSAPSPVIKKMSDQPQTQELRKSVLLKGLRSMEIDLPEKGKSFSFQKLGGNPEIEINYIEKDLMGKIISVIVLFAGGFVLFAFRHKKVNIKIEFKAKQKLQGYYYLVTQSKMLKLFPSLLMGCGFFFWPMPGVILILSGFAFNTIILLQKTSLIRYKKKGYVPPFYWKIHLKYLFSYLIILCTPLSFIENGFIFLGMVTVANTGWLIIYAVITFFTRNINQDETRRD